MTTSLSTLFLCIDFFVALGVLASTVLFIQHAAKLSYSILDRVVSEPPVVKNTSLIYRSRKMYPSNTYKHGGVIFWDAPIFFANTAGVPEAEECFNSVFKPWCLVLNFSGINDICFSE